MKELVKISFINSADYEDFWMNLDGDVSVVGINDSGKTTCKRAVIFGEHGSEKAMDFGPGETIDYYFHKGPKDGMMVYDYADTRDDGLCVPYCLMVSSQFINFVMARFDKKWLLTEEGRITTEWNRIRVNIREAEGDVEVFHVSSRRNLEQILQGTYRGKDPNMARAARLFNMHESRDGKPDAGASIIQTVSKNGTMLQNDLKRILVERSEMNRQERFQREPEFDISASRSLSDGFDEGWKDFSCYTCGELPAKMNIISTKYKEYNALTKRIMEYPSNLHGAINKKENRKKALEESEPGLKSIHDAAVSEWNDVSSRINTDRESRMKDIGAVGGQIKQIEEAYNAHTEEEWTNLRKEIKEWDSSATLLSEKETLKKEIEAIEGDDKSATKAIRETINQREKEHDELKVKNSLAVVKLFKDKEKDPELLKLNVKKNEAGNEAEDNLKKEKQELDSRKAVLEQQKKDLERAEEYFLKLSGGDSLVEKFRSSENLSFLGNIAREAISRFFRLVFAFFCKEIFGIREFSQTAIEEKRSVLAAQTETYEKDKSIYGERLKAETERISAVYEGLIVAKNTEYANKQSALEKEVTDSKNALDAFVKEKNEEIDAIRAAKGIDIEALKKKKKSYEQKENRYQYLFDKRDELATCKQTLKEYGNLEAKKKQKKELETSDKALKHEEEKELAVYAQKKKTAFENLESLQKQIGILHVELTGYPKELERRLTARYNLDLKTLKEMVTAAAPAELAPDDDRTLAEYIKEWDDVFDDQAKCMTALRTECQTLQMILSNKDHFEFSIKPEDSMTSDRDILRVAGIVTRRNDAASAESINVFLNNWRSSWNQYLRFIYKIAERTTRLENIESTVRSLQSFVNANNTLEAISSITFEIERGSENPLVKKAIELKDCLDANSVDVYSVDVTDGVDSDLFKLEVLSTNLKNRLVRIMSEFTAALSEYKKDTIPPEDFFKLYTVIKEQNKPKIRLYDIKECGSTGTSQTLKAFLAVCFVGEAFRSEGRRNGNKNAIHIFVDEFGRIDKWNQQAIKSICRTMNVRLFSAEPDGRKGIGDTKYGYALNYDKVRHIRSGEIIVEKITDPVTDNAGNKREGA